jgi:hypothetical protein
VFVCLFVFRRASKTKDIFVLCVSVNGPKQKLQQTEECQDPKLQYKTTKFCASKQASRIQGNKDDRLKRSLSSVS